MKEKPSKTLGMPKIVIVALATGLKCSNILCSAVPGHSASVDGPVNHPQRVRHTPVSPRPARMVDAALGEEVLLLPARNIYAILTNSQPLQAAQVEGTIQYNTIQYNTIQYNTIQYNTIQYIQYNTIQYNTIQYNTIQYNTMQCNAMQCNAMQCNAMQCNAMQCNAMQCNAMQCNAMQCNAMQCNAMQCNAMQCNAIRHDTIRYDAIQYNRFISSSIHVSNTL